MYYHIEIKLIIILCGFISTKVGYFLIHRPSIMDDLSLLMALIFLSDEKMKKEVLVINF